MRSMAMKASDQHQRGQYHEADSVACSASSAPGGRALRQVNAVAAAGNSHPRRNCHKESQLRQNASVTMMEITRPWCAGPRGRTEQWAAYGPETPSGGAGGMTRKLLPVPAGCLHRHRHQSPKWKARVAQADPALRRPPRICGPGADGQDHDRDDPDREEMEADQKRAARQPSSAAQQPAAAAIIAAH